MAERLTDRVIKALKPPRDGSTYHFDTEIAGLVLRVYSSGRKVFCFDWREHGRQRRVVIGQFPAWTIGAARAHAGKMRLKADTGEAVAPGRGGRVADLVAEWREVVQVTRRPNTVKSYGRLLKRHIVPAFGLRDPRTLTRNDVEKWHGALAQRVPIDANRSLAVLSAFLTWCQHGGKIEHNAARGIKRGPENQRHTFLDASEIKAAHAALDKDEDRAAALAIKLALLTGCRISEACAVAPGQLDVGRRVWVKQPLGTKQKRVHVVPLQPEAVAVAQELLRIGPPGYDDCRRAWIRVRTIIKREDTRIHDLRHSRASALARNGASLPMIGRLLGHSSPAITARYAHLVDADLRDLVERS